MSKPKPNPDEIKKANQSVSRPEDPDTHRLRRGARRLRADMLPAAVGAEMQAEDWQEGSETEAALRRATESDDRAAEDRS